MGKLEGGVRERSASKAGASVFRVCPLRRETFSSAGICHHRWTQLKPIWGALLSAFQARHTHRTHTHTHTHCTTPRRREIERNDSRLRGFKSETEREKNKRKDQQDKVAETFQCHCTAHSTSVLGRDFPSAHWISQEKRTEGWSSRVGFMSSSNTTKR